MNKQITRLVEHRLEFGAKKYGKENMTSDGRDFVEESLEEILDGMIYIAGRIIELKEQNNDNIKE